MTLKNEIFEGLAAAKAGRDLVDDPQREYYRAGAERINLDNAPDRIAWERYKEQMKNNPGGMMGQPPIQTVASTGMPGTNTPPRGAGYGSMPMPNMPNYYQGPGRNGMIWNQRGGSVPRMRNGGSVSVPRYERGQTVQSYGDQGAINTGSLSGAFVDADDSGDSVADQIAREILSRTVEGETQVGAQRPPSAGEQTRQEGVLRNVRNRDRSNREQQEREARPASGPRGNAPGFTQKPPPEPTTRLGDIIGPPIGAAIQAGMDVYGWMNDPNRTKDYQEEQKARQRVRDATPSVLTPMTQEQKDEEDRRFRYEQDRFRQRPRYTGVLHEAEPPMPPVPTQAISTTQPPVPGQPQPAPAQPPAPPPPPAGQATAAQGPGAPAPPAPPKPPGNGPAGPNTAGPFNRPLPLPSAPVQPPVRPPEMNTGALMAPGLQDYEGRPQVAPGTQTSTTAQPAGPTGTTQPKAPPPGATSTGTTTGAPPTGAPKPAPGSLGDQSRIKAFDPTTERGVGAVDAEGRDIRGLNTGPPPPAGAAPAPGTGQPGGRADLPYDPRGSNQGLSTNDAARDLQATATSLVGAASVAPRGPNGEPPPVGQGAIKPQYFKQLLVQGSEGGRHSPGESFLRMLNQNYQMYLALGKPDKANAYAYGMVQAANQLAAQYGAQAMQRVMAGDTAGAAGLVATAVDLLPDGMRHQLSADGQFLEVYDSRTGQMTGRQPADGRFVLAAALGLQNGTLFWNTINAAARHVKGDQAGKDADLASKIALRNKQMEGIDARIRQGGQRGGGRGGAGPTQFTEEEQRTLNLTRTPPQVQAPQVNVNLPQGSTDDSALYTVEP